MTELAALAKAGEEIAALRKSNRDLLTALQQYEHDYCEGWCKENGGIFDDCGGCRARSAIAKALGRNSDDRVQAGTNGTGA